MDKKEWEPSQLFEISGYYWKTCTLHAAVKLDVFTAIGNDHLTGEEIALKLNGDARGVTMLLNALTAMELLTKTSDKFSNTRSGKSLLSKDSQKYIGYMIMHHHYLMEFWAMLDKGVITGKSVSPKTSFNDEEQRESFLMGMFNSAMGVAPGLAKETDLSGRHRLLDLGGDLEHMPSIFA